MKETQKFTKREFVKDHAIAGTAAFLPATIRPTALHIEALAQIAIDRVDQARPNGCTVNVLDGELIRATTGYGVSAYPHCETKTRKLNCGIIETFVRDNWELLSRPNHALGIWRHKGQFYIDVTKWMPDRDDALRAAKSAKQLAVWDCAAGKEIYL